MVRAAGAHAFRRRRWLSEPGCIASSGVIIREISGLVESVSSSFMLFSSFFHIIVIGIASERPCRGGADVHRPRQAFVCGYAFPL